MGDGSSGLFDGMSPLKASWQKKWQEDTRLQVPVMPVPPLGQPTLSQLALMTPNNSQEAAVASGSGTVPPTAQAKPPVDRASETGPPAANTRAAEKALADKP